jgi:Rieske Fe-S protein
VPADRGPAGAPPPKPGEAFPRSRFLEGATLGLGVVIGGLVTVPPLGLVLVPSFLHQGFKEIDVGPISNFPEGKFVITTFVSDPSAGDVSRRTAYIRNNGNVRVNGQNLPSFTILSNHCAHLGCPVQPNGPIDRTPIEVVKNPDGVEILKETGVQAAGFGCPCHGGAYDTEGNRTAGPPVRALDRYLFSIKNGHVILGDIYSVRKVEGTGANAKIKKTRLHDPGQHVDGDWESFLWPIPSIHGT